MKLDASPLPLEIKNLKSRKIAHNGKAEARTLPLQHSYVCMRDLAGGGG